MKKKYIFGILFSIFTLIFVSACNSPSNIKANFKQAQYTLSIGESINLSDEFNVNGVDKSKVSFESSNPDVALLSDGILKAQDSGSVYVLAKLGQDVLAQAKVQVKYKFSSPQNISVSQIGTLSWDKSYISNKEDGRVINAEKYNLSYALVTDGELEYISTTVSTNSFQLPNTKGVYKIKLQAISQTDEFDNSELVELSVNYGVMGALENVALTNETTGANATISWKEKTNAKYDVYVEGFMVYENFNQNRFTYDFDQYSNLSEIKVEVVAKSTSDDSSLDTSTDIIVTRLKAPELSCTGGQLSLSAIPNAKGYLLKNFNDASDILKLDSPDSIIMEGYESGIYTFSAMAEGSNGDGLFLNSNFSSTLTFTKLEKPTYSFEMTEKGVKIIFEKSSVGVLYNISYADKSQQVASSESGNVEIEVDMSSLSAGEYTFALQALPTSGTAFTNGTISTSNVVKSDILTFKVYKTEAIGSISHTFSGKQSIISFDQLEHANKYQLFINDEAPVLEFTEKDGKILFTIDDLSAYSSVEGDYTFKVLAYLEEDDVVVSTTSTQTKTISILDSPQGAENQTNGYYAWEGVAGEVEYYYEIYQTDEFYEVDEDEVPVVSGTTKSTTILDELPFGYYKIYVYSRSTDYNQYLDCDFEDKGNILSDTFIVSSQITSPQIAFKEDGGVYKLDITISRYASKYTVYIDDVYATELNLASESWSDEEEVIKTIPLDDKFTQAKDYNISVVASGGSLYDETLHIASQASSITVTRVAEAKCEVEIKYDAYGRISHEYLVATKSENTTSVKAYRGDSELNVIKQGENFLIDMLDSEFGGTFAISLVCKAKGAESGHYYLDSMAKSLSFERVETPQNLAYSNGTLSFECDSANVENYLACIEIIKDSDVTAYYTFEIESTLTSLDLQTKIEEIISSSAAFKTAYNDMDNLKISLYAIASSQSEEGTYFIPSLQSNVVTIGVLSQATLSFDQATQTLSWELEDEAQSYDLYVGGEVKVENITSSSITLSQITGLDLSVTNEFTVLSKHSEYFDSKLSNVIKIRQLRNVSTAVIAKNGSDFQMTVNFTADNAISAVYVNGEKANFSAGSTMANIAISTSGAQSVQLIALEGLVDGVYCINSSVQTFTLQQLGAIKLTKSGDTISWNNPSLNVMSGNSGNPYSVQLVLTDGETSAFYTAGNDETSISIKDIEDIFKVDLNDDTQDFTISGKVVFGSSYSLNITSPSAVGLYGESVGQNTLTIYKLQSMGDVEVTFAEDDDASDNVSAQMNGVVKFTFEDLWSDLSNANFVLTIGSREIPISAKECNYLSLGSYALSLDGGKWTLSIPLSYFASQRIPITFNVVCEGNVDSDGKDVLVTRLKTISEEGVTLSEEGILSIDDTQTGASYAITITHANGTKTGTFSQREISKIDITTDAWLKNLGAGDYTIKIVAYDESGKLLPSLEVFEYSAHQYEGIIEAYIDDEGKIILSVA
ncbi:MAG: hypothetical protein IJZ62_00095, partial [Clostridia bacterium]|nr:hypothetical protein [Clostridia bacterium]